MDNTSVRITIGNERTTVVETKDYKNSIFEEQYKHALHEVVNYLRNDFTDVSQIIAFCGDRGEGKTSCMLSFSNLINNVYSNSEYIKNILDSSDFNLLSQEKFLSFPLLDPSYFEKEYSVLEYLTGLIYNYIIKSQIDNGTRAYHNVLRSLQDVKRGLHNLHKRVEDRFDPLDEIGALALGLNLKESLKYLIRNILSLYEKSRLVLLLDDIDLNMEGAYSMVEQIRKYLCIPECIILTSVNLDQLQTAIAVSIQKNSLIDTSFDSEKVAEEMARKYIDKLIPASARINMPKVDALCERPLVIVDRLGNTIYNNSLVKDGVVELIFQKTRYLFYNSKGGVSRVVPNNLRELMHLVGLLAEMPYVGEKRENLRSNQREFKDYFFKIWTQKLPSAFLPDISDWINSPLDNALNKNIIDFFSTNEYFEQYLQKDFSEHSEEGRKEEETVSNSHYVNGSVYYHSSNSLLNNRNSSENPSNHIDSILSSYNFSYNIHG